MTRSEQAFAEIVVAAQEDGTLDDRVTAALKIVRRYEFDSRDFHTKVGNDHVNERVNSDMSRLRDLIDGAAFARSGRPTRVIEVSDRLTDLIRQ